MRLALDPSPSHAPGEFIVSESNAAAVAAVEAWPAWPGGRLALIGPEGSGKTHLARVWAERVGAMVLEWDDPDLGSVGDRPVLLEDADRRGADEPLFHLINMADAGTSLLITGRETPSAWPARLPDLRSRLNALVVARMGAPDDVVLRGVVIKLFRERNIRPPEDAVDYLLRRIERSIPAAAAVVARIDEVSGAEKRNVTRAFVRQILEDQGAARDLFE